MNKWMKRKLRAAGHFQHLEHSSSHQRESRPPAVFASDTEHQDKAGDGVIGPLTTGMPRPVSELEETQKRQGKMDK